MLDDTCPTSSVSSGLPVIGAVSWGTHLCQFYDGRGDLLDALVPYFRAGLLNNEQCLWITSAQLDSAAARAALRSALPDAVERERSGQIEIVDRRAWQSRHGELDDRSLLQSWLEREAEALRRGHAGLRVSGDTCWLEHGDWAAFSQVEANVHGVLHGRRIVALCSYCLSRCGSDQIIDVLRTHKLALVRRSGGWEVVESATVMLAAAAHADESASARSPAGELTGPAAAGHSVCFYEGQFPSARIAAFLAESLDQGGGALVIASAEHQASIGLALAAAGVDERAAREHGRLIVLDGPTLLARLTPGGGAPDPERFDELLGDPLLAMLARCGRVSAFGEMVDELWQAGRNHEALALEMLWNRLILARPVSLLCGYQLSRFDCDGTEGSFERVCRTHAQVVSSSEPASHADALGPDRLIVELRHKQRAIESEVGRRRALEIEHAGLLADERSSRVRAVRAVEQIGRLQKLTSALSEAATSAEIAHVVVTEMAAVVGAHHAVLVMPTEQPGRLRLLGHAGVPVELALELSSFPVDADVPVARAFAAGQAEWLGSSASGTHATHVFLGEQLAHATAALPLGLGSPLGALAFGFAAPHGFAATDRALLEDLARQVTLAIDRALLLEDARRGRDRSLMLANLSNQLGAARLGVQHVLDTIIAAVTERLADACVIQVRTTDEDAEGEVGPAPPVRTPWRITVPLHGARAPVGALTATRHRHGSPFNRADEALCREIGERAGLFIENAQLHELAEVERRRSDDAHRAKDELLGLLGHELRDPLSPIVAALQLMRLRGGDVLLKERAVVERQVQHMTRLVDDLLDVSRITQATLRLERGPVALADVIATAIEAASPIVEERAHTLDVSIAPGGLVVEADTRRLAQAFTNILLNVARFTDRGGRIVLRAGSDGEQAFVEVRDNGIGVDAELLPRLFDVFFQGHGGAGRGPGGLGVGLTIARALIELHGGRVSAHSAGPGTGCALRVELPLATASLAPSRP